MQHQKNVVEIHCGDDDSLADDRLVLNPGSVGLPAYDDDQPVPHIVENGTPEARYAIVQRDPRG